MTFLVFTLVIWTQAKWNIRITRNRLTLKPYLFMMSYFATLVIKNLILVNPTSGAFSNITTAYFYLLFDYISRMSLLMAFGAQMFEW